MRRALAAGVVLFLAALAHAAAQPPYRDPRMPQTPEERQFDAAVSRAIYQIMPQKDGHFVLTLGDRTHPVFPGEAENSVQQVQCERLAAFGMLGYATELGHVGAEICKNGARVRELAAKSRAGLAALLKGLGFNDTDARKAGWYYAQETLSDGAEFYYFPVLLIGHGVLGPLSGVLYDKKTGSAVVVQIEASHMCGEQFVREFKDSPFCTDMRAALKRIALALRGS